MRSEYDAHFTKKNSINNHPDFILMKQQKSRQRAKTAKTQRILKKKTNIFEEKNTNGQEDKPEKVQKSEKEVWTRDSIVNVNKMK